MDSCAKVNCVGAGDHRIVLLGPPGSGKGTVALELTEALGVPHISTGQMFREAIRKGGPLAETAKSFIDKGQLVPDEITVQIVRLWLDEHPGSGFIFDGFPRTLAQAQALDQLLAERKLPLSKVVLLELGEDEILERILGRLSCENCGALYHVSRVQPKVPGICDKCGSRLVTRADDNAETVRERLRWYRDLTGKVVEYYDQKGLLIRVDGSGIKDHAVERVMGLFR